MKKLMGKYTMVLVMAATMVLGIDAMAKETPETVFKKLGSNQIGQLDQCHGEGSVDFRRERANV